MLLFDIYFFPFLALSISSRGAESTASRDAALSHINLRTLRFDFSRRSDCFKGNKERGLMGSEYLTNWMALQHLLL